jgi:transcriptional repressor of cell division inhibition gene dicB
MLKTDVITHFGSPAATARALGITKSAVSQWGDNIPERMAYRVQTVTDGVLTVDPSVYQRKRVSAI